MCADPKLRVLQISTPTCNLVLNKVCYIRDVWVLTLMIKVRDRTVMISADNLF